MKARSVLFFKVHSRRRLQYICANVLTACGYHFRRSVTGLNYQNSPLNQRKLIKFSAILYKYYYTTNISSGTVELVGVFLY
jgi:hypothetical protein